MRLGGVNSKTGGLYLGMLTTLGMVTNLGTGVCLTGVFLAGEALKTLYLVSLYGEDEIRFDADVSSFFGGAEGFLLAALGG